MKTVTCFRRMTASLLTAAMLLLFSCGEAAAGSPPPVPDDAGAAAAVPNGDGSVDLTVMSSTMVYAEVYNMVTVPDQYMGRTVRMKGDFATYTDPASGKVYFACVIADATACCSQGLEFQLKNASELTYPDDYPEEGKEITVTGTFSTYVEDNYLYCQLVDAVME